MEITIPTESSIVIMTCDACKEGEMEAAGYMLLSNPPQYPHRCNKCGKSETYSKPYPIPQTTRKTQ